MIREAFDTNLPSDLVWRLARLADDLPKDIITNIEKPAVLADLGEVYTMATHELVIAGETIATWSSRWKGFYRKGVWSTVDETPECERSTRIHRTCKGLGLGRPIVELMEPPYQIFGSSGPYGILCRNKDENGPLPTSQKWLVVARYPTENDAADQLSQFSLNLECVIARRDDDGNWRKIKQDCRL
jgi:hypothetical protein